MSLHQLANHMSAQGRGPDSTLVHMSPREVSGLQSLAMAHGGTLTVNPQTGLPEAGFLDSLMPTLLGGAATFFSGGAITPFMAALGVGGLTALTSKDLGKGLMAGLGAYGGSGIAGGLMNFGEAAIGAEAAKGALPSGIDPVGADAGAYEAGQAAAAKTARAGASNFDRLSRGVTEGFKNPMGAFSSIGGGSKLQGALMVGAPLASALASQEATPAPTLGQIAFDPRPANINIRRDQLPYQPDTGSSGQRGYFGPTYVGNFAAEGGFVSDDGIEHFAAGGIPLDPDYDYSGYGRKKTDVVRPVTPMPDVPKPDFLAADGKTYRYDPIKKSWYVIKDVEAKTNAGVETLMGGNGSPAGGENPLNTKPDWGTTFQIGKAITSMGLPTIGGYLEKAATNGILGQSNEAAKAADAMPSNPVNTSMPQGYDTAASRAGNAAATAAAVSDAVQAAKDNADNPTNSNPTNSNPLGGDVTSSTPVGGVDTNAGEGGVGGFGGGGYDGGDPGGAGPRANGGMIGHYAQGGLGSLGGYSDGGRLLRGPGDGVSDSIPATVGDRQPARLADGEFVVPARIVSELGNGSTEAGARALYKMMDRIQANRRKTTGKNSVAVNSKSHKYLPA